MAKPGLIKSTNTAYDSVLDARGWHCPLPILHAIKALNQLSEGQVLHVIATDPGSVIDFSAYIKQSHNALLESSETNGEFHYLILYPLTLIVY